MMKMAILYWVDKITTLELIVMLVWSLFFIYGLSTYTGSLKYRKIKGWGAGALMCVLFLIIYMLNVLLRTPK